MRLESKVFIHTETGVIDEVGHIAADSNYKISIVMKNHPGVFYELDDFVKEWKMLIAVPISEAIHLGTTYYVEQTEGNYVSVAAEPVNQILDKVYYRIIFPDENYIIVTPDFEVYMKVK